MNKVKFLLPSFNFMSKLALALFFAFCINTFSKAETKFISNYHFINGTKPLTQGNDVSLVHENRLEKIVLGTSLKQLNKLYPTNRIQKVLIYDAHRSYQKVEILNKERTEVLFTIDPDCSANDSACIIRRINIKSTNYHTSSNLRVGKYYVDIMHSSTKVNQVLWYEGNLIARVKQSGISYVLQTNSIPRPWYETMDKETLPDSIRIIGIMITGKSLDGIRFDAVDSLNKQRALASAITKPGKGKKIIKTKQNLNVGTGVDQASTANAQSDLILESSPEKQKSDVGVGNHDSKIDGANSKSGEIKPTAAETNSNAGGSNSTGGDTNSKGGGTNSKTGETNSKTEETKSKVEELDKSKAGETTSKVQDSDPKAAGSKASDPKAIDKGSDKVEASDLK